MPEDKLLGFYNVLKQSGAVEGLPDDFNKFKSGLSKPENAKGFYETIKSSGAVEGLPDSFDMFSEGLGLGKPEAAPLPGGGGGLISDITPEMDGGKSDFGIAKISEKIGQPKTKTVIPYSEPQIDKPIKEKKSELIQEMIFKKDVLEYNKLNLEQNQGRFNNTGLNLAVGVAQKAGRGGPDALNYAKRLQGAAVNQQAAGRIQKQVDDYQKSLLGDTGLQNIKNYNQSQLAHKESENLSKQSFAEKNKDLFPTVNKEEQFRQQYMAPFEKNANLATKKLSPVVQSLSDKITQQFKESGGKDFVLSSDAGKVPDPEAINNYVEDKAYILGFGDDKLFKSYLKTQLQGAIEYALIEPEVNKKFQATPAYQKIEKEKVDAASKLMAIPVETKKAAVSISEDINNQYKMAIEPLNNGYVEQQNNLKATYETSTAQITQQAAELNRLAQEGQIDQQSYEANINQLNVQSGQLFKDYNTQFEATNQAYLDEINKVNTKYNSQYRRRVQELTATNEAVYNRLKGEFDKMGLTPQDQVALQEAYKKSYQEAVKEKLGKEEERTFQTALLKRVVDRFSSGIGSTMRAFGQTFNNESLKLAGEQLLAQTYLSPLDYETYKKGVGSYLLESFAQLGGSMAAGIAATSAVAAVTGGTGLLPLAAGAVASWSVDSATQAGNIGADVFEKTGSVVKASDAAEKTWETQIRMIPLYAFESVPFMKGFIKSGTILGRVAKGAALEFVPELAQDYSQNIFEEAIKKGEDPYGALSEQIKEVKTGITNLEMNPAVKQLVRTGIEIGPVVLFGAGGVVKDVYAEKREKFKVGKFVSKLTPADFANDAMSQFVYRTTAYKGEDFATSVITSLYTGGQIDKPQFEQMVNQVQRASQMYESAQKAGLTNPQFVVLSALGSKAEQARELANKEPADSPLKAAMEYRAKTLETMAQKFSANEKVPVVITTLPNGNQVINTLDEIKERLNNPEFASELLKGGIKFDVLKNDELAKELGDLIAETIDKTPAPTVQEVTPETAPAPQAEVAVGEEITTKTKPNEIKTETKEPAVLEGVRDGGTEAKGREVSPELRTQGEAKAQEEVTPQAGSVGVGGEESRKKEMKSENDKLQKRKFELATERDEIIGGDSKYRTWGQKQTDARLEEIRSEVSDIDAKQVALQKELKVIEAKETGSVELFDHPATNHGSTNTIIYDIKNDKLVERENVVRGKTKDISIEDAAKQKFAKTQRGRNQREINEAYTDKVKAKYEAEINNEIAKYKEAKQSLKETPQAGSVVETKKADIEAKKAEIERIEKRRQEELSEYPYYITIEDSVSFPDSKIYNLFRTSEQRPDVTPSYSRIAGGNFSSVPNFLPYIKTREDFIKASDTATIKKINEINAKYDAELKAVEQSLKETPQAGSGGVGGDVEATAKALNEKQESGEDKLNDVITYFQSKLLGLSSGTRNILSGKTPSKETLERLGIKEWNPKKDVASIIDSLGKVINSIPVSAKTKESFNEIKGKFNSGEYSEINTTELMDSIRSFYGGLKSDGKGSGLGLRDIAEAYHKAKADGSNPELVEAVEQLLGKPKEQTPQAGSVGVGGEVETLQKNGKLGSKEDTIWQQDPIKIQQEYRDAIDKYKESESDDNGKLMDDASKKRREYQASVRAAYSAGNISEAEIKNIQSKTPDLRIDIGDLKPVGGKEVYHLSVSASDVENGGFLTKDELLKKGGKEGLGGGRGGISLTWDKQYAERLFRIFNEIKDALNGKVNIADEFKKLSTKAQGQIIDAMKSAIGGKSDDIRNAIENNKTTYSREKFDTFKGFTNEEIEPSSFIKHYYNALSLFSDLGDREWVALHTGIEKLKDADIGIFKGKTKENAHGEVLPAEREYHVFSGDAVENLERITPKAVEQSLKETPQAGSVGVGGDVESRKKEMKSENDKLIKRKRELANDRDDVVTSEGKYKNFGKKERDARLEEIRSEVNDIDAKQVALQKELKAIEAKETGSVELFDHPATNHGSTNTIIYDIKNDKLVERENVVRGKTKDISIEDAAKQKFAKTLRGRNQREINEAYTDKVKAKYEAEITDEIAKYKSEQSLKETPQVTVQEEAKSPIAVDDFKVLEAKGKKGRDARAELKDRIGEDNFKKMDKVTKQFDAISKDLEAKGLWKKICP